MTGDIRRRVAAIQAALKTKSLQWGNDDDDALAKAIRDIMAGRPLEKVRDIVAATAAVDAADFQALLDLAKESVEGPPPGHVPPPRPKPKLDTAAPMSIAELLDKPVVKPTYDVKEAFDEMDIA